MCVCVCVCVRSLPPTARYIVGSIVPIVQALLHRRLSHVQSLFAQSLSHNVVAISGSSGSIVGGARGSLCCIARRRAARRNAVPH